MSTIRTPQQVKADALARWATYDDQTVRHLLAIEQLDSLRELRAACATPRLSRLIQEEINEKSGGELELKR